MTSYLNLKDFKFTSSSHSRYQNGTLVGSVDDCYRGIYITENPVDDSKYLVTIYILDEEKSRWGDNIQMSTKQMKIEQSNNSSIQLRGYGEDPMGNTFTDYGVTIFFDNNEVQKVVLQLFDRNVEMHYSK
jgi:hypothetical protein